MEILITIVNDLPSRFSCERTNTQWVRLLQQNTKLLTQQQNVWIAKSGMPAPIKDSFIWAWRTILQISQLPENFFVKELELVLFLYHPF